MNSVPNPLPPVLDATCGSRSIWFDKAHPFALYVDRRREHHEGVFGKTSPAERTLDIEPDVLADFTALPFPDESFWHVVWDPPHLLDASPSQWYFKAYGTLRSADWREVIGGGGVNAGASSNPEERSSSNGRTCQSPRRKSYPLFQPHRSTDTAPARRAERIG